MPDELLTTAMRKATKRAHAISDALVNAKLLFAINNNSVWGEGLIIFYEIFKFLETAMQTHLNENFGKLYISEAMNRTPLFEKDLNFYLGSSWKKNYIMRESVQKYLSHLEELLKNSPDLLMAYIYHLYMGLLSGGQILKKKRDFHRAITGSDRGLGGAVTSFEGVSILDLKTQLKDRMNSIAENLDENTRKSLIAESIRVFEWNNSILTTVKGAERVALKNIFLLLSLFVLAFAIIYYICNK